MSSQSRRSKTSRKNHSKVKNSPKNDIIAELKIPLNRLCLEHKVNQNHVKLSSDKFIVTRMPGEFRFVDVELCRNLEHNRLFVVQVLEVDPIHVGGLRFYTKNWYNFYEESYSGEKCAVNDYFVFWKTDLGYMKVMKNGKELSFSWNYYLNSGLYCEMYGSVNQICVFQAQREDAEPVGARWNVEPTSFPTVNLESAPGEMPYLICKLFDSNEIIPSAIRFFQSEQDAHFSHAIQQENGSFLGGFLMIASTTLDKVYKGVEKVCRNFNDKPYKKRLNLEPLSLNLNWDSSRVKLSEDNLIATRVGDYFKGAFVVLSNDLQPYEFIGVRTLNTDPGGIGGIGGIRLHCANFSGGHPQCVYEDDDPKLKSLLIFWISPTNGTLYCSRDGENRPVAKVDDKFKLICEMYGSANQINAYIGRIEKPKPGLHKRRLMSKEAESNHSSDLPKSHDQRSISGEAESNILESDTTADSNETIQYSADDAASRSDVPHLILTICDKEILIVEVKLPSKDDAAECLGKDAENNSELAGDEPNQDDDIVEREDCKICMDAKADVVLIPCGHMCFCYECSGRVAVRSSTGCPICRADIKTWKKFYVESKLCQDCQKVPPSAVLLPCGDMCFCQPCLVGKERCPVCRLPVEDYQPVFHS